MLNSKERSKFESFCALPADVEERRMLLSNAIACGDVICAIPEPLTLTDEDVLMLSDLCPRDWRERILFARAVGGSVEICDCVPLADLLDVRGVGHDLSARLRSVATRPC